MCTAIVSIDPKAADPVLLVGVRDEFRDRPWQPPGPWWPERFPGLLGGRDLQAGGTWLAVDPAARRVACVLNGHGIAAKEEGRRSRGELPLLAAAGESGERRAGGGRGVGGERGTDGLWSADTDLSTYDPFHLVLAEVRTSDASNASDAADESDAGPAAWLWSWDGAHARERRLGPGLHVIVNSGLEGLDDAEGPGVEQMAARIAHFRPRFEAARRPDPTRAATESVSAWGEWLSPADGDGLSRSDPRALILERELAGGRLWGTSSVSLVALGAETAAVRYDFSATPGDPAAWRRIR